MMSNNFHINLRRWIFFFALGLVVVCAALLSHVYAAEHAAVIAFTSQEGDIYLPLRTTCEQLGYNVTWFAETQSAYVQTDLGVVEYALGENEELALIVQDKMYVSVEQFAKHQRLLYVQRDEEQVMLYRVAAVNSERMLQNLEQIAITARPTLSAEIEAVRELLSRRLDEMGYEVTLQPVTNPLSALMPPSHPLYDPNPQPIGSNVIARKPALDNSYDADILILGAAYDSLANSPGANGNGSGVVGLLEIAELVKDLPSHVEIRLVFFAAEASSGFGSYQYASSLTHDEIQRTVAMIDINTIGSIAEGEITAYTLDGRPNSLTEQFHEIAVSAAPQGSYTSFYSLAIPTVRISEELKAEAYFVLDRQNDTLDIINQTKLQQAVTATAEAVANLMSDATTSSRKLGRDQLNEGRVGTSLDISKRLVFDEINKEDIEEQIGIDLTQVPVAPSSLEVNSSFVAYVDWWGAPRKTYFQFTMPNYTLTDVYFVTPDVLQLTELLDDQFSRLENSKEYRFTLDYVNEPLVEAKLSSQLPTNNVISQDRLCWRSNVGHAFVLEASDIEATLWLSSFRRNKPFELADAESWQGLLSDQELQAWERVEEMLQKSNLFDRVESVVFVDDGYGGETLAIISSIEASMVLEQSLTIYIDAMDIADSQGQLYRDEDLLKTYFSSWASFMFTDLTQVETALIYDESGQIVSISRGEYLPTSYLRQYVEAFGVQWVNAYIAQESLRDSAIPDSIQEELSSQLTDEPIRMADFIVLDLMDIFVFYMSENYPNTEFAGALRQSFQEFFGDGFSDVIRGFFNQFPELVEVKEAFTK